MGLKIDRSFRSAVVGTILSYPIMYVMSDWMGKRSLRYIAYIASDIQRVPRKTCDPMPLQCA